MLDPKGKKAEARDRAQAPRSHWRPLAHRHKSKPRTRDSNAGKAADSQEYAGTVQQLDAAIRLLRIRYMPDGPAACVLKQPPGARMNP